MFFRKSNPYMNAPPFRKGEFVSIPSEINPRYHFKVNDLWRGVFTEYEEVPFVSAPELEVPS
tara:strand:- start:25944 stop:26129 length:186 start_codon:yes stop_codon:yes gene_type:complete